MTPALPTPEAALCSAYRDQAERYHRAAVLAESLPTMLRADRDHSQCLGRVMALLAEAAAIEERLCPVKEQWVNAGGKPGAELREVLAEVTRWIERLARGLAEAEQEATARQAQLAPQVETLIRGRVMRRAYRFA